MLFKERALSKLVLVAGYGELPDKLAESACQAGEELVVLALNNETYKRLSKKYTTYKFTPIEVFPMLDKCREHGAKYITFIGKVPKLDFFKNIHKLDKRLLQQISKLKNLNDDSLHLKLADFLKEEGDLTVVDQTKYLKDYFPAAQVFTKRSPTADELEEINYGLQMAKSIAALDIGQAVVVKNRSVIAVESIEGTNACIKRAVNQLGIFAQSKSVCVCKVAKPNQDKRFDVPTVGLKTLKAMSPASILAFEANETFFVEQEAAIAYANQNNIAIISTSVAYANS